jgi:hypothetical protein
MRITGPAITVVSVLWASAASAQGVYVGGAIGAEVVRSTSTQSGGSTFTTGSGEAFAGAIRVGTGITERVGVEVEFFRPGEIEGNPGGPIYLSGLDLPVSPTLFPNQPSVSLTLPSIIGQTSRVRATTTSALLVARQPLGGRVELAYLGGVGFSRVVRETEFGLSRIVVPVGPAIRVPYATRTTQYAAGPVVGVEVRAGMTAHAQVVAGLRMHTLGQSVVDGWMIRPSVGLAWKF